MHVRTHTREHLYYCSQCHYSSITKNCLKRHVIQKHSNILLKCPTDGCDYSTPDKYKLQAHLKVHTALVSSKPKRQPRLPWVLIAFSSLCIYVGVPAVGQPWKHREVLLLTQLCAWQRLPRFFLTARVSNMLKKEIRWNKSFPVQIFLASDKVYRRNIYRVEVKSEFLKWHFKE